jgi:hypothetical protein
MSTKITLKNGYKVMRVNWASNMTDTDIVNAAAKQKGEEEGGEYESEEEGESSEHISHSITL